MRATLSWLGALLCAGSLCESAQAYYPNYFPSPPLAPGACSPGFYPCNAQGAVYGPTYWVPPGSNPGTVFTPIACGRKSNSSPGRPRFRPTRLRSPRDYFMLD